MLRWLCRGGPPVTEQLYLRALSFDLVSDVLAPLADPRQQRFNVARLVER